jgi:microcystin-dependent protein
MASAFIGEIRMFGGNFAPAGWAFCQGQLLAIQQYSALFALLGTTYGGNGTTTFALPNLQGRVPIHQGQGPGLSNYVIGQMSGTESVALLTTQLPQHSHLAAGNSNPGTSADPTNNYWAASADLRPFSDQTPNGTMQNSGSAGSSQPHENMPPFLAVNFIIALLGIFPSRN